MSLALASPAKINLFLHVTGKRRDGYHELNSLMVPVGLEDRMVLTFEGQGVSIACSHPEVPEDNRNLVWKAAELFEKACREKSGETAFEGIRIDIHKTIPVGGGLGGGSSNAATLLTALNHRCGRPFSQQDLMEMGLALGADVPFFIHGGAAWASGVGEVLTPCDDLPDFSLILCWPGVVSSTAQVFKKLDYTLTLPPNYIKNTGSNVLPSGQGPDHWRDLHNDLEGPACRLYPQIGSTKEEMELLLKRKVFMSGSGSSLFALFSDHGTAERGFSTLSKAWSGSRKKVFLTRAIHSNRRV